MEIGFSITFDSYIVLRNVLDDCRVRRLSTYDYSRLFNLTMKLEHQATRKRRIADVLSLVLIDNEYLCVRECAMVIEVVGLSARSDKEVQTLITELDWSCTVADALIGE